MGYRSRPCLRLSVFVFDNDILQVYRDKNLRLNLDLRTPSLSSLYLNLDLRNFEPFESQYPQYAPRLHFFRLPRFPY